MSDLHTENAKKMFDTDDPTPEQRRLAKARAFHQLYRSGGLSKPSIIPRIRLRHWLRPMRLVREIKRNIEGS